MNVAGLLPPPLLQLAQAIGLVSPTQDLDGSWFENPLSRVETILTDNDQREALFDLLDQVLPPQPVTGAPAGSKWHPLLGALTEGNLYLTIDDSAVQTVIGLGGRYGGGIASLLAEVPLLELKGGNLSAVVGSADGPVRLLLDVELGWTRPAHSIALSSISLALVFAPVAAPPTGNTVITLRGLDLDGAGAKDVTLDPTQLGGEAITLIFGLVHEKLQEVASAGATGDALAVAAHLIPLLGLDGSLPVFPFATLATDPQALMSWLRSLTTGATPPLSQWLVHFAGLLGVSAPTITSTTSGKDSVWSVVLFAPNAQSSVSLGLVRSVAADAVTQTLGMQMGASLASSSAGAPGLDASVSLFAAPLGGSASASVFPAASVVVRAPAGTAPLIAASAGSFSLDSVRAGIRWDGTAIAPLLELDNVVIPGAATFPTIDLTNANTVIASAASGLIGAIVNGLGATGPGAHLAALAGLVEPASDTTAPLANLTQLVTNPTAAIATLHRNALLSTAHPWSIYLSELAALLSLPTAVAGTGTPGDPWSVPLASGGPWGVVLVAWNAQTSGNPADPQRLRIGLRAQASNSTANASWTSALLGADLPAAGANHVTLFAEHDLALALQPPAFSAGSTQLSATNVGVTFSLAAGASAAVTAAVNGLVATTPAGAVNVPTLAFPFPAGFDPQNPAAALGISAAQLEDLVAALLSTALEGSLGAAGRAIAVLLGCGAGAAGLPPDLPSLTDTSSGTVFTDPAGAWLAWLAKIATSLSADGSDLLSPVAAWLTALVSNNLPTDPSFGPDVTALGGTGTYDDPWVVPLGDPAATAQGLLWLEPNGPQSTAAAAAAGINAAADFPSLIGAIGEATRYLGRWPDGVNPAALGSGLQSLAAYLSAGDGVVPTASQLPSGGSWGTGTALDSAHSAQPADPAAISQILAQVDAWIAAGSPRVVLLLGPAFSDHTIWTPLLAQAEAMHAGTTQAGALFNLRIAGVAPASIDLRPVTAVADYYAADLQDDGSNDIEGLSAQIALVVARLNALRPGAPLIVVAHSTAGVVARAYAAGNAAGVRGFITLGTPHQGAPLTPLVNATTADALRVLARWLPGGFPAGPLQDAFAHLQRALDGYLPPPAAGALPVASPYPVADFDGDGTLDTGGVPALALGGRLGGTPGVDLLASLKASLSARVNAYVATPPSHLAFAVRADLDLGGGAPTSPLPGVVAAEASLRIDLGRVALQDGAAEPARAAHALTALVALSRPGGWLVGDSRSYAGNAQAVDVRVRSAQLGLVMALNGTTPQATPFASLQEVAFHSTTAAACAWSDPVFSAALGSIFSAIGTGPDALPGTRLGNLLAVLQAIGIATAPADAASAIGLAASALNALTVDALGFLAPKLQAAFTNGAIPGFSASPAGGFTAPLATLPLEAFVTLSPPTFGLRTTPGGPGVALGGGVTISGSAVLRLSTLQPVMAAGLQAGPATLEYAAGALTLQVTGTNTTLSLIPAPSSADAKAAFAAMLPPLLLTSVASALIDGLLAPGSRVAGLYSFLQNPRTWLLQSSALGDGSVFDPVKLTALISRLGALPAGLTLTAVGKDPSTLSLATTTPLGGVLAISAGVTLDRTGHATPSVTLSINTPTGGTWPQITLAFGLSASGLSLVLTPSGAAPIQLLPSFDGAAALAGAAKKLLPEALDALLTAVTPGPTPPLVALALDVAAALDLYDGAGGFDAHAAQIAALTGSGWFSGLSTSARSAFITAVGAYFNDPSSPLNGELPGTISVSGNALAWTFPLPSSVGSGSMQLTAGWDGAGPTLAIGGSKLVLVDGPITLSFAAGYADGTAELSGGLGLSLESSLGINVTPQLAFSLGGSSASTLTLLPLGAGTDSTLSLQFAPTVKLTAAAGAAVTLGEDWVVPLVADLLIAATGTSFSAPLYAGGPTIETLLSNANLISIGAGPAPQKYSLKTPLPAVDSILMSLLQSIPPVPISLVSDPPLGLLLGNLGGQIGVALQGSIAISSGSPAITLLFGQPGDAPTVPGAQLILFTSGATPSFAPALRVRGIGVGLSGDGNDPLFNEAGVRIGSFDGFIAFNIDLVHAQVSALGGGLEIGGLGLPLGLLDSATTSNPVASSLLGSGSGSGSGDSSAVNPALDVEVTYLGGSLAVKLAGTTEPVVIPVHASFGPLYIDQLDIALNGTASVAIGIDGSLSINGLTVGVDELALEIPFQHALNPDQWSLDLQGLAVGFESGPVEISGGLRKNPGPPIEYDGMLSATIADIGLTVVGGYSRPSDAQGGYTSLFLFVSLPLPLGGPPFAFVTGLGGGFGYNRELIVPTDLDQIDSFVLVAAIDDDSLANDPLNALMQMSKSIPARRGAFWLAAGARITTCSLINSVVVVSIAVDRGVDINILGVSRMALPTESAALVSVELALRATFNSAEQMLSVQAQLTDNSYLFSRDCQLTGGFALVIWYGEGQFVVTLGGYNPVFTKPPQFPDVPRLGFNWSVGSLVVIKGGAYFGLTNSCVMAGGSLSATASIGPVSAWFDAYLDFLVAWDPFAYEFDIGVEIGARVSVTICFFGCVTIGVSICVGAQLTISGPPFHGTVSIDAYVTTITVAFGNPPQPPPYITDWSVFAGKYLTAGDPNNSAVSVQVNLGLLPVAPPGAQPQPGTQAQPWQVGAEFVLSTTTRMPAASVPNTLFDATVTLPPAVNSLDLAPMGRVGISSYHTVTLQQRVAGAWVAATITDGAQHFSISATQGLFPEATWHWTDPQHLPAAARTIGAIAGFTIDAHVRLNNESALIPISTLVADLTIYAKPLPFATTAANVPTFKAFGVDAEALALAVATAPSRTMLAAASTILTGTNTFSANRAALGLAIQGLPPLAAQALRTRRSAPPLLTPLTTGLTMRAVGLPSPIVAAVIAPTTPVLLAQPRLRAVFQSVATPVTDAAPALHTSVDGLLPSLLRASPRTAPPGAANAPAVVGARLLIVPAAAAPRPTRAALPPRAVRNADLGAAIGPAHQRALDQAAADLAGGGVTLGAGATHLWDVPDDTGRFTIRGSGAVRMLCTDRSGNPLSDLEFAASGQPLTLPATTAMVAITCLGQLPDGVAAPASGFGAVTGIYAPTGEAATLGWQSMSTLTQVGPARFMARGATVRVITAHATSRNGQRASCGTPRAADVVAGQFGIETRLPTSIGVVMLALDLQDPTSAQDGDLALAVSGGTLAATPRRIVTGSRRLLLYDVSAIDPAATALLISVASVSGHRIDGVVGLHGRAVEWATRLSAGIPDHFVPDGAFSPAGSLSVTYTGQTP